MDTPRNYSKLFADLQREFIAQGIKFLKDLEVEEVLRKNTQDPFNFPKEMILPIEMTFAPSESPWHSKETSSAYRTAIDAGRLTARAVQSRALLGPQILIDREQNLPLDLDGERAHSFWDKAVVPAMQQRDSSAFPYAPAGPGDLFLSYAAACSVLSQLAEKPANEEEMADEIADPLNGYSPGTLGVEFEVSDGTLRKYALLAGVPTPARGERNFIYTRAHAEKIAQLLSQRSPSKTVRSACEAFLNRPQTPSAAKQ